ncbi:O-methyltransferase [Candidatus Woesearchaeota archaeon]|nr:O-methyltransferase [Candidatus Woesearchaeota archaeon]
MRKKIKEVLTEINQYAEKNHDKCWCVPFDEGKFLHLLVQIQKPKYILEIGTSIGFSTIWMASAAEAYGGTVKTIEINNERAKEAQENFKRAGLKNITLMQGDAQQILKELKAPFDMIFLDAGKEHYLEQLKILEKNKCIKEGTVIIADNAAVIAGKRNEKLQEYLEWVRNSGKYSSMYIPFENGMEVSVKL